MPFNIKQRKIVLVLYKDIFLEHVFSIFSGLAERIVGHVDHRGYLYPMLEAKLLSENQ
jgi:hypothetical protein